MSIELAMQGTDILLNEDDCQIDEGRMILLADIPDAVAIEPGQFARIPTPLTLLGDGRSLALIEMHIGRHHNEEDEEDNELRLKDYGEFVFLHRDTETRIIVDVINETDATVMVSPKARIGLLNIVQTHAGGAAHSHGESEIDDFTINATYEPLHLDHCSSTQSVDRPDYSYRLKADIPYQSEVQSGEKLLVPTGLRMEIPAGFEAQLRPNDTFEQSAIMKISHNTLGGQIAVSFTNTKNEAITILPAQDIAEIVIVPIAAINVSRP